MRIAEATVSEPSIDFVCDAAFSMFISKSNLTLLGVCKGRGITLRSFPLLPAGTRTSAPQTAATLPAPPPGGPQGALTPADLRPRRKPDPQERALRCSARRGLSRRAGAPPDRASATGFRQRGKSPGPDPAW